MGVDYLGDWLPPRAGILNKMSSLFTGRGLSWLCLFEHFFFSVEDRPSQLLRHALADGTALHEGGAGHRLNRHVPPIARDPFGTILEARRLAVGAHGMPRRHIGGDGRAVDQDADRDDQVLVDRPVAVIKA